MKDVTGKEIQIGDRVVTAQKQGSSNWLNIYPVIGMENGCPVLQGERNRNGNKVKFRLIYVRDEDTIAIVEKSKPEGIICDQDQVCRPSDRCAAHTNNDPGDEDNNRQSGAW